MRFAVDWLAEFIDLPPDAQLAERLNLGGFEDAAIVSEGPDLSGVIVGRVLEREAHPNADRLSLCRVATGEPDPAVVVCGAPNVAADQKIAFAPVGTRLPDGTKLKKSKIRGVVSSGMICSARELGLGDDHDGILVLPADAPIGAPVAEVLRAGRRTLDFGITPNRGDAASLLGVAREVQALVGGTPRLPETAPDERGSAAAEAVTVSIDAPEACHHYVARVVRGVRIEPSPAWLTEKLESAGVRPINNVVDITNLVLLEFGQPLHAFDLATVRDARIDIRLAAAGEKLTSLDGEARSLDPRDLVICDAERPIALAGVMGGVDTEVADETRDVLIESAHFAPAVVRLTARRHGLQTEASYRFERGVDREGVVRAADRAARLMAEIAGGTVARGTVEARGAAAVVTESIDFDLDRANGLLGTAIDTRTAATLLRRVGLECADRADGRIGCRVPTHRNDLHAQQDVTEELARVYGYDRIPATVPTALLTPVREPAGWRLADTARDALVAAGLTEVICLPFVPHGDGDAMRWAPDDPRRSQRRVVNPIKEEEPQLRSSLVPSLLRLIQQNRSRQVDSVALFEIARCFRPDLGAEAAGEPLQVAAVLSEPQDPALWAAGAAVPIFFRAKGVAERLLIQAGYVPTWERETDAPALHPGAAARVSVGGTVVGSVGELHPQVATHFGIDVPCAVFEMDLDALRALAPDPPQFREVSRQPLARRDIAVLLDRDQPAGAVLDAIRATAGSDLLSLELFDRYEGRGVPEGRVSLAFRLAFQRADRALTEKEIGKAMDRVVRMLTHRFGGELR